MRNSHLAVPLFFALALVGCSADEPSLSKKKAETPEAPTAVNEPPVFTAGADQTVAEDAAPVTVSGWATGIKAGPDGESGQKVEFTLTNDNNALFSVQPALSPEGDLTFTVAPDVNGSAEVTVVATDDGGTADGGNDTADPAVFTITVTPVNDVPAAPTAVIKPDSYAVGDNLYVLISKPSADADGDTVSYRYVWMKNDVDQGFADTATTVSAGLITRGDTWKVFVTPHDGAAAGVSTSVTRVVSPYWFATGITAETPSGRSQHTAVWTGSEMIVWGGLGSAIVNTGGRYNPTTDSWLPTSTSGAAPAARWRHSAVWTGKEMIVWGGSTADRTGGAYHPATDSWRATDAHHGAPTARGYHTAVWTGREMIIWGGKDEASFESLDTGARYDPIEDSWTAVDTTDADLPARRDAHQAVWTGKEMIVWGGQTGLTALSSGGRYDPVTNTWAAMTLANAPQARFGHSTVWTGREMIVWGGSPASGDWYGLANGGRYDPETDTWTATSGVNAPLARLYHTAVWTGRDMLVWGGASIHDPNTYLQAGARYVPATDTWSTLEGAAYAPSARNYHSAVWTGREMIVWGGETIGAVQANTGGRFVAGTSTVDTTKHDVLVAMDKDSAGLPSARADFVAVWTGQEMVVWGGREENGYVNTGGRYNPVTDTWLPTSTAGAVPDARMYVTAVWTGREMIVWGGENLETGGRYNPLTDSWTATSLTGAPLGRTQHSAVWTGRRMLIWGGARSDGGFNFRNDGGAYDPATDTWEALGTGGETPAARGRHGAVWTGREMIVWGGTGASFTTISSGDRYDPQTGTWSKVLEDGSQPAGRTFFTPLWTGREMIVWSGPDAGGRYDPEADTWTPISTAGAPAGVYNAAMVWTGGEMIVWGGLDADYAATNAGARYDPATDRWTSIGAKAPMLSPRHRHRAVWTGSEMLIWGGADALDNGEYGDGARYVP